MRWLDGWHHWLNGHEFDQILGDGEGQGRLAWCSPWGCKELDMTEWLNSNNNHPSGIMQDWMFLWWPGKKCYSLAGKFWLICCIHQTVHHWISIYFRLYKILLMEKIAIPWKNIKGTWNSSLLKKIKSLGKPELWHCLKMAEGSGTKQWLRCSIMFLVKMKTVSYSYFKTKRTFWPT